MSGVKYPEDRAKWPQRWDGPWHIVNIANDVSLESHFSESRAAYWCASVNDHETRCAAARASDPTIPRRETQVFAVRFEPKKA